ncbi:MAG: sulfurtransferase [Planctomycetota bacterium]|jgi:thiosulfate/3-mercaptopyruvate sulfurtransferase
MTKYAHPGVLVETDWVQQHLDDPSVRLVEIDVDTQAYDAGHIPSAAGFNWQSQLQDNLRRDILSQQEFAELVGGAGISPGDTVILYGDNYNWFAAYGFWLFKMYGHEDVRLMNGGRLKWLNEDDKPLTTERPSPKPVSYKITDVKMAEYRAMLPEAMEASQSGSQNLVDVRSPDEFTGKIIAPPDLPETAQRGGHIPGARNIPWSTAVNTNDGTFKSADELRKIYLETAGVDFAKDTIAYCRIGERSSHTWFVLKYLLGIDNVKNYDGSWTEYGNLIAASIEK